MRKKVRILYSRRLGKNYKEKIRISKCGRDECSRLLEKRTKKIGKKQEKSEEVKKDEYE